MTKEHVLNMKDYRGAYCTPKGVRGSMSVEEMAKNNSLEEVSGANQVETGQVTAARDKLLCPFFQARLADHGSTDSLTV